MQFSVQGRAYSASELPGYLIQSLNGKASGNSVKGLGSSAKAWYDQSRNPNASRNTELLISEVLLTQTGISVFGKDAPGSIEPDFAGKDISLTLKGIFKDKKKDLALKDFLFTLEPPLIQQTFGSKEPKARVLLDDSILLDPVSVSGTEIKVVLHTQGLPDLYLKGLHRISVEHGDGGNSWYTDGLVRIGEPVPVTDLKPGIETVEILRDKTGKPLHIRCSGKNFLLFPKFSYTLIDGRFGFGFRTEVSAEGRFQTIVHIPNPDTFDRTSPHQVIMATPFGVSFKTF
ncbi:MAG: hypothetical protein CVV27_06305 [Candidatus Melainabacteria bacterium HGW-Melainabacteria-1]|nr:MAG: hypothetical protein CVV27_06305 [Candidatus Melainabacteria bacterium HGW-Melainabacteria-1]